MGYFIYTGLDGVFYKYGSLVYNAFLKFIYALSFLVYLQCYFYNEVIVQGKKENENENGLSFCYLLWFKAFYNKLSPSNLVHVNYQVVDWKWTACVEVLFCWNEKLLACRCELWTFLSMVYVHLYLFCCMIIVLISNQWTAFIFDSGFWHILCFFF